MLLDTLARPLWRQYEGEARARRQRVFLALPLLVPLALASAPHAAAYWSADYATAAAAVLIGFMLMLYASTLAESALLALLNAHDSELRSRTIAISCDIVIGSIIGRWCAAAFDTSLLAAISLGGTVLPVYNVIVAQFLLGGIGETLGGMLIRLNGMPAPAQYSRADALAARGLYVEALAELELAVQAAPQDPRPLLHGARMLRDSAHRYSDAVAWFRRARRCMRVPSALDAQVARELAELLLYRLQQPERALAELARLAHTYRDTPAGAWAATTLRENKSRVLREF
ncbi:MAG TPA: hypothetical protein VMN60_14420 [Longimicrobiales bacterium]|nr:hypothetical protein [Longimicrobiales bacterium]